MDPTQPRDGIFPIQPSCNATAVAKSCPVSMQSVVEEFQNDILTDAVRCADTGNYRFGPSWNGSPRQYARELDA
jgi:hypothetical protein